MENKNEKRISLWNTVAKETGREYLRGETIVDGKKYKVVLYFNEKTKDSQPDLTGKLELATN